MPINISKMKLPQIAAALAMATGAAVTMSPTAQASDPGAETIRCPLTQARRTITDDLPSGWWTTPIVSRLSEAKIVTIAGRKALQCVYGSSGRIQRNTPRGKSCRVVRNRYFVCRSRAVIVPPASSNPGTFKTGPLTIRQTFVADLDSGTVGGSGRRGDIWFQAETRDLLYIHPRNGAKISVGDRSNRGYAGCSRARYTSQRASLRDIPVGSYVCVKTSAGRISQFRMNRIVPADGGRTKTLKIGYTTWNR